MFIRARYGLMLIVAAAIGGCATAPHTVGPPSTPQLLSAGRLELPADCHAQGSMFVSYTVLESGSPANIAPDAGPACVQQALTAWIATFRYSPQTMAVPVALEWLVVEADRS